MQTISQRVSLSGFCVFLVKPVKAETARSGAIANKGYIAIPRVYCKHQPLICRPARASVIKAVKASSVALAVLA
jgi:hypothetical protein